MRKIRDVLPPDGHGHVEPQDCGKPFDRSDDSYRLPAPGTGETGRRGWK
jgi:hypothetical protein